MTNTGIDGLPSCSIAGNVLRPETVARISIRLPPTLDLDKAKEDLIRIVEENPPYNATVKCTIRMQGPGWNAPETKPYLEKILENCS